jgi:hypothetical protein
METSDMSFPDFLKDFGIQTTVDSFGQEQYSLDLGVNPLFGVANCRAVFDKQTRKWRFTTSVDAKVASGSQVTRKRPQSGTGDEALSAPRLPAESWVSSLPDSPHVQSFVNDVDWSLTPLGPLETWPVVLQTCCHLVFADSRAAVVYWGESLITIPNHIYIEKLRGRLHKMTELVGRPFYEIWPELHEEFVPLLAEVADSGRSLDQLDVNLFPASSSGLVEETFWSGSFLPIKGELGKTLGFYNRGVDTTKEIIQERWIVSLSQAYDDNLFQFVD